MNIIQCHEKTKKLLAAKDLFFFSNLGTYPVYIFYLFAHDILRIQNDISQYTSKDYMECVVGTHNIII